MLLTYSLPLLKQKITFNYKIQDCKHLVAAFLLHVMAGSYGSTCGACTSVITGYDTVAAIGYFLQKKCKIRFCLEYHITICKYKCSYVEVHKITVKLGKLTQISVDIHLIYTFTMTNIVLLILQ